MTPEPIRIPSERDGALRALGEAASRLAAGAPDLRLDFSAVDRIGPETARALEELSDQAGKASVNPVLTGVNIGVYRVLKLLKVAHKFSYRELA